VQPVFLYLAEAHAADTWPLSAGATKAHTGEEDRLRAARALLEAFPEVETLFGAHVYADAMTDAMATGLGLWPERYVLTAAGEATWASSLAFEHRWDDVCGSVLAAASTGGVAA